MNLLEGVVALVILGASAVSYFDLFRTGAESVQRSREWAKMVQQGEAAMEAALLGDALQAQNAVLLSDSAAAPTVRVEPWRDGLSQVVVTVSSRNGQSLVIRRLMQR